MYTSNSHLIYKYSASEYPVYVYLPCNSKLYSFKSQQFIGFRNYIFKTLFFFLNKNVSGEPNGNYCFI